MTSGLEAAGDLATGALVAGAVEPDHGVAGEAGHGACANCGATLIGAYCHGCGQSGHIHRSLAGFGHDLLHGVFHFDGKFWATLPMLFLKPGELTRRYIHGERAKFVSPLALFLFSVFLMFAIFNNLPSEHEDGVKVNDALSVQQMDVLIAADKAKEAELLKRIRADEKAGRDTTALWEQRERIREERSAYSKARTAKARTLGIQTEEMRTDFPWLSAALARVQENPGLFAYQLKSSAYKYSWLLIPISTPLLWLLFFWKRQYKLYDHLIFVTFSLSFMMLLVTLASAVDAVLPTGGMAALAVMIAAPVHMYRQLRGAYPGSRAGAVLRTGVLVGFAFVALLIYLLLLLALGVMH